MQNYDKGEFQLKTTKRILPLLILIIFLSACGYHNPNVYSGPEKSVYLTNWKNRTNELRLDMQIYQALSKWYQKSSSITVTKQKENADVILAGEIVSIDLPSLSYGSNNAASEVKLKLKVRYILKDLKTDKVLLEVPGETWTEEYLIGDSSTETADNESEALKTIVDDLSQKIYRATIKELPNL